MPELKTLLVGAALAALAAGAAQAQLIPEIQERGTLRVGVAEGPPYQYPDAMSGDYVGLNIDLANEVAELLGVELEIVPATWATLVPGLEVDQYDVIFANLFATPERAVSVAFTDPYDTYGFHVMVRADSDIQTLEDVNAPDVSFAGVAGTVEAQYPRELFPEAQVNELVTDQANAGASSVLSGQSDAVLVDPGLYRILTAQNPSIAEQTRLVNGEDELLKPVSLSYALEYGDDDMMGFLNVFIRDKVANGAIAPARDAWFDRIAEQ
jgi:polar amino acid transport system substrate-binding protein